MISALKAELRKILTVRSTYFILLIVLALLVLFAFFISGIRIDTHDLHSSGTLAADVTAAISAVSALAALVGLLLMTHEYRYNTIMYTLTSAGSRNKVILAKILVMSGFAVIFTLAVGTLSPLFASLGIHLHHAHLVAQSIPYKSLLWHSLFFGWGYVMAGLLIAALIRNQIGAVIVLLFAPGAVEGLLSLLLKKNTVYLPFTALHAVLGDQNMGTTYKNITPGHAALVFSAYLVVGWVIAWYLFVRRDAS